MTRITRAGALFAFALLVALPSPAATAREMYATASARAKALHEGGGHGAGDTPSLREYRAAAWAFEAVARQHPTTGYADNALFEAAALSREAHERFGNEQDKTTGLRLLNWLLKEYPTSPLVTKARDELKRWDDEDAAAPQRTAASPQSGLVVLRDIRRTVMGEIVRVTIELDAEVSYRTERIDNPARVLFDLAAARLAPSVPEGTLNYPGDVVRHIRVGRHPNSVLRVVLDIEGVKRYSAFTLYGPYRIVVDCERGPALPPVPRERIAEEKLRLPAPDPETKLPAQPEAPPKPALEARVAKPEAAKPDVAKMEPPARTIAGRPLRIATRTIAPVARPPAPLLVASYQPPAPRPLKVTRQFRSPRYPEAWQPAVQMPAPLPRPDVFAAAPAAAAVAPAVALVDKTTPAPEKPMVASEPPAPPPNGFSMARQLGLGASRIVIDPGHGGHDPGAEGSGVFEATIVLDVALRLEKLLTGAGIEAVLTRRKDEYIPLEERTAIANRAQGDLFLSIHANASRNRAARGVESYVLNFASTPDAEAVAARENASTGLTMSSLTEIVKAIALNNKLDESRNLAGLVQREMVSHLGGGKDVRNHGVKQAPFVVLIGASMPSVLVEVSFITHSQEGRLLKSGAYRQKIAEALFDAVRGYQKSLKGTPALTRQ